MSIPYEELEALIMRQYKEIEELQKLCAERPAWPDMTGMDGYQMNHTMDRYHKERDEWEHSIDAAGRRESISSKESKHPQEEL